MRFARTALILSIIVALAAWTMSAAAVVFDLLAPVLFFVALAVVWREWRSENPIALSSPQFVVRALRAPPAV